MHRIKFWYVRYDSEYSLKIIINTVTVALKGPVHYQKKRRNFDAFFNRAWL